MVKPPASPPFVRSNIHISRNADWEDTFSITDADLAPRDCTGYAIELVIIPAFDDIRLIKRLTTDATETFGPEHVVNGSFAASESWDLGAGWIIASGVATKSSGGTGEIKQNNLLANGSQYELTYAISGYTGGTLTPQLRATGEVTTFATSRSSAGSFTERLVVNRNPDVAGAGVISFVPSSSFAGSIDNASLREVRAGGEIEWIDASLGEAAIHVRRSGETGTANLPIGEWAYHLRLLIPDPSDPSKSIEEEISRGSFFVHPGATPES